MTTGDGHGGLVIQQIIKQSSITRHGQVQVLMDLKGEGRVFLDEAASMTSSDLQFPVG